jgi:primase-polymerase (primpol)-like protein
MKKGKRKNNKESKYKHFHIFIVTSSLFKLGVLTLFKRRNTMDINIDNIPTALKKFDNWVCWDYELDNNGRKTKVPKNAVKGYRASIHDSNNWASFEECIDYSDNFDGIGYILSKDDPFTIWDLDECYHVDSESRVETAKHIIKQLNSYTEISPSGDGLRVIVKAKITPYGKINRKRKLEVYQSNRFLTITGNHLPGTPKRIKFRQRICNRLHQEYIVKESKAHKKRYCDYRIPNLFGGIRKPKEPPKRGGF